MDNNNPNNGKRMVSRQSWEPIGFLRILKGLWTGCYSVIKVVLAALITVLLIAGVCVVVFVTVLGDYLEGDIIPQAGMQLEGFDLNEPSVIYYIDEADNIQVLQKLYASTDSDWVTFDEIPENLIYAAVSIEDHRFYEHQGVDWFTTIKACISMFVGGDQFGGSSITQQLIKNIMLTEDESADDVTVQRKVLEIFRATEFEKKYDKTVILEWYLNYIYLGNGCTGVKTAAAKYFGKELEDLTPAECAIIISITNNPSKFNPYRDNLDSDGKTGMEQLQTRYINTLWLMNGYGYLSDEDYAAALEQEIVLKNGVDFEDRYSDCLVEDCGYHGHNSTFVLEGNTYYCPQCGTATAIGEDASQDVYSWFVDTLIEDLAAELAAQDEVELNSETMKLYRELICKGGYHIYSTLDMKAQNALDNVYTNLDEIPTTSSLQQLESGMVIIDNETGDIAALCGGVGEKVVFDAYNRATVPLQPGSSIKPLTVYAPAFELELISPATVVSDLPLLYTGEKDNLKSFPKNDNKSYSYARNIYSGITSSVNAIAVNTLDTIGLDTSFYFARDKFRLSTLVEEYVNDAGTVFTDIAYSPLGMGAPTQGVTVRDMAAAFATFANGGVWREARTFTHVYNSEGELVLYNEQESERILSEKTVNYMNYCLDNAVANGTGTAADISGQNVAGKTGTTSSAKDRWFCGFTGYYTAAVWCGYDMPEVITLTGSNRSNPAARLFNKVLTPLHKGLEKVELYDDSEFVRVGICKDSGKLATEVCKNDCRGSRVVFGDCLDEDIPTETCDQHIEVDYCTVCKAPANEYCYYFEEIGKATITTTSLLKMTQARLDELVLACKHGLESSYASDSYVYLVDNNGNAKNFYGINGDKNKNLSYPYIVGTTHNNQAWQEYVILHPQAPDTEETTEATVPSETEGGTEAQE